MQKTMIVMIGLQASGKSTFYEKYLSRYGVKTLYLDENGQVEVMKLIYDCVKAGHYEFDVDGFRGILRSAGAENCPVILGCTELPIAFKRFDISGFFTVDPALVLAKAIIRAAGGEIR